MVDAEAVRLVALSLDASRECRRLDDAVDDLIDAIRRCKGSRNDVRWFVTTTLDERLEVKWPEDPQ
jgi:hypothetical protein